MSVSTPLLYVFAISHYCEKARWALDYLGIDYELRFVAPGEHRQLARKLGARHSYVPYLSADGQLVQGSANIIDWADDVTPDPDKRLTPVGGREQCEQIEKRIDDIAGVHVRRLYYSEALVEYPGTIRPFFTRDLPLPKKLLTSIAWGKIRKIIIADMDLGAAQRQESRDIVERELDWVDELLADGRNTLLDSRFSRADIAVASLLSPLVLPAKHPTYQMMQHPPKLAEDIARWAERPSLQWVSEIYDKYR